jgi:predicted secreted hydrolase
VKAQNEQPPMTAQAIPSRLASQPEDYNRLGIKKRQIEPREDGLRTTGGKGTYEWWYFDAHLNDGSKTVIDFFTKEIAEVDSPLSPCIRFTLDRTDGTHIEKVAYFPAHAFSASKETCDVRIGPNTFKGDLHTIQIHVELEDIVAAVTLKSTVPPWRPETGYLLFGEHEEHYFAWLPSVPQGDVNATLTIAGKTEHFTGIGYHDHNWGNISLLKLVHHWYWARGKIGDYTLIASYITAEKRYGYKSFPIFMLARNGQILADDETKVRFSASDIHIDKATGKPIANVTIYDYKDGNTRYVFTFERNNTILRVKLVDTIRGIKRFLARLIGFDGAFHRFTGGLTIDHYEGDRLVTSEREEAIWELMYFGHVPKEERLGIRD